MGAVCDTSGQGGAVRAAFPLPMKNRFRLSLRRAPTALLAAILLVVPAAVLANLKTERFWLENMVTREICGPVLRQTGHRFQIGSQGYVVLDCEPGHIRVAKYPQGDPYGPYDIVESRIIDIGLAAAYNIVNVQRAEVPELPPDLSGLVGVYVKGEEKEEAPPPPAPEPIPMSEWPLRAGVLIEPFHTTDYDWKVGGYEGKKSLDLKSSRLGVRLDWGNGFVQLGHVLNGKQSGSITPDLVSIESLHLESGSGFSISGGYFHPFPLADGWDALVGGAAEFSSESYDLVARTLIRKEVSAETPPESTEDKTTESETTGSETTPVKTTYSYEYGNTTSSLDLSEFLLTVAAGVQFHEDYWGAYGLFCIDLVSNVKADGSVMVNGNDLSLEAERSHPIGVEAGAWCYVFDQLRADAAVRIGATQLLRLAVSWEW